MESCEPNELAPQENDFQKLLDDFNSHEKLARNPEANRGDANQPVDTNSDFVWNDYLEDTGALAAPPTSFLHVERSLESGFKEGMKLEVPNKENPETYWVASIVVTCGPLLRLRYEGCADRSAEFWVDVNARELHPIGWGDVNNRSPLAPQGVTCKVDDWGVALKDAVSVPVGLLEAHGATPIDRLQCGMYVEVEDETSRRHARMATIVRNVGGRLKLRYVGEEKEFWLFYLSYRLHGVGWSNEDEELKMEDSRDPETAGKLAAPCEIFLNQESVRPHGLRVGLALETIDPGNPDHFCAARATRIVNDHHFEVTVDGEDGDSGTVFVTCITDTALVFPVGWSLKRKLNFTLPKNYSGNEEEFEWKRYLEERGLAAAPEELFNMVVPEHGFESGMKLEVVNPADADRICVGTVSRVVDHVMYVQLETANCQTRVVHVNSHEIFPVGWCESNGHPIEPPLTEGRTAESARKAPIVTRSMRKMAVGKAWCPHIYFNHKCFSGPYLSKGRIAELPRQVGPGSVMLVMKEVLSLIINVAYKSSKVLTELSSRVAATPGMQHQVLKAKYKGRSYRGLVEIVRSSDKVGEFCRAICRKLECCPYLFGPLFVGDECPDGCSSLTKTKYGVRGPCVRRRRRMGRPPRKPGQEPNGAKMEVEEPKPVKVEDSMNPSEKCAAEEPTLAAPIKKRRYVPKVHPKLEIITRKAKLPNYALQLRRRRRRKSISPSHSSSVSSAVDSEASAHSPAGAVFPAAKEIEKKVETIHKAIQVALPMLNLVNLEKSPLLWSVDEVVRYMKRTDCAHLARVLKDQEIDGQALLLLTLPTVQEHLELKLGPAMLLCHHIERIKLAFYAKFAN